MWSTPHGVGLWACPHGIVSPVVSIYDVPLVLLPCTPCLCPFCLIHPLHSSIPTASTLHPSSHASSPTPNPGNKNLSQTRYNLTRCHRQYLLPSVISAGVTHVVVDGICILSLENPTLLFSLSLPPHLPGRWTGELRPEPGQEDQCPKGCDVGRVVAAH